MSLQKGTNLPQLRCLCGELLSIIPSKNCYWSGSVECDVCELSIKNELIYHCKKKYVDNFHSDGYDICQLCVSKLPKKNLDEPLQFVCQICGCYKDINDTPKCHYLVAGYMRKYINFVVKDVMLLIYDMFDVIYVRIKFANITVWDLTMKPNIQYYRDINGLKYDAKTEKQRLTLRMKETATFDDMRDEIVKYYGIDSDSIDLMIPQMNGDNGKIRVLSDMILKDNLKNQYQCNWNYVAVNQPNVLYTLEKWYNDGVSNGDVTIDEFALYTVRLYMLNISEFHSVMPEITLVYNKQFDVSVFIEAALDVFKEQMYRGQIIEMIKRHNISDDDNEIHKIIDGLAHNQFCLRLEWNEMTKYDEEFTLPHYYNPMTNGYIRLYQMPTNSDDQKIDDMDEIIFEYYNLMVSQNKCYRQRCDIFFIDSNTKLMDFIRNEYCTYNTNTNVDTIENEWKIYIKNTFIVNSTVILNDMGDLITLSDEYNKSIKEYRTANDEFHLKIIVASH